MLTQMKPIVLTLVLYASVACSSVSSAQESNTPGTKSNVLVRDDYSEASHPLRKALRGDWSVADGVASVKQDDELYKQYKNHGPIMVYEVPHTDASAVVEFKPNGCKTVVFTMDAQEGGHAFRVIMRSSEAPQPGIILTYAAKEGAEKAQSIVLNREVPGLKEGQWHRLEAKVEGGRAIVKLDDQTFEVEHPRISQQKKIVKLGFSFGELAIRQFKVNAI